MGFPLLAGPIIFYFIQICSLYRVQHLLWFLLLKYFSCIYTWLLGPPLWLSATWILKIKGKIMNILILGSGGREYSIGLALKMKNLTIYTLCQEMVQLLT